MNTFPSQKIPRKAGAALNASRIVKPGTGDFVVVTAAAATDPSLGVLEAFPYAAGEPCTVCISGIVEVVYGGTVAAGDPLTSDASGRAIKATVAGQRCVGIAQRAGTIDQIGLVQVSPFIFATA